MTSENTPSFHEAPVYAYTEEFQITRNQLLKQLPTIELLLTKDSPITLDQLANTLEVERDKLIDVCERYGWSEGDEEHRLNYAAYETEVLEDDGVLRTSDAFMAYLRRPFDLSQNNLQVNPLFSSRLFSLLRLRPRATREDDATWEAGNIADWSYAKVISLQPFIHRAHAVAPELFSSLRFCLDEIHKAAGSKYNQVQRLENEGIDGIAEQLELPENKTIKDGMFIAYKMMLRLVSENDPHEMLTDLGLPQPPLGEHEGNAVIIAAHNILEYCDRSLPLAGSEEALYPYQEDDINNELYPYKGDFYNLASIVMLFGEVDVDGEMISPPSTVDGRTRPAHSFTLLIANEEFLERINDSDASKITLEYRELFREADTVVGPLLTIRRQLEGYEVVYSCTFLGSGEIEIDIDLQFDYNPTRDKYSGLTAEQKSYVIDELSNDLDGEILRREGSLGDYARSSKDFLSAIALTHGTGPSIEDYEYVARLNNELMMLRQADEGID